MTTSLDIFVNWSYWCFLFAIVAQAKRLEFYGDSFTNLAVYDGKIYIGAKNYIHVLNAENLAEIEKVSTCGEDCNNINKILLIDKYRELLISCGSGQRGICELRSLNDIKSIKFKTSRDMLGHQFLAVSTNEQRPAIFILSSDTGNLYTGVTYGSDLKLSNGEFPFLSAFMVSTGFLRRQKSLYMRLKKVDFTDYLVFFKAGFQHNGYFYFVTNQQFQVGYNTFTSKILRICENDTHFYSYTDIELKCTKDNITYNLIQDASVFKIGDDGFGNITANSTVMVATFASGPDPERPQGPSAVCIFKIEDIDRNIMKAKENFINCLESTLVKTERYLFDARNCGSGSTYPWEHLSGEVVRCSKSLGVFSYVIGDQTATLFAIPVFSAVGIGYNEYLHRIWASTVGNHAVLRAATSSGKIFKLNVYSDKAEIYETKIIDEGYPITGIHVQTDGKIEYIMSKNKLVKLELEDCSTFTTCLETMEAKNPLCGWCVYESKSTFQENSSCQYQSYSGQWLSSLQQCQSLDVHPRGVPINTPTWIGVTLKPGLHVPFNSGDYRCRFISGKLSFESSYKGVCKTPSVSAHSDGRLELFISYDGRSILLAGIDFLFYDCGHYNRCGECTGDDRAQCAWNPLNTMCALEHVANSSWIFAKGGCPTFQNKEDTHFLPSDVHQTVTLSVINLVNSSNQKYFCSLDDKRTDAVKINDNQIQCILKVSTGSAKVMYYSIHILYGTSMLEEENRVVVYNCQRLATDCSKCRSVKYANSHYKCDWCFGACTHSVDLCVDVCDPAKISTVYPNSAAVNGSTLIIIDGTELGSRFEDIQYISLAGISCAPVQDNFSPSFRVACLAGASHEEASGKAVVIVNNQSSTGDVLFSYKLPRILQLTPMKGPKIGGTTLTAIGTDLGVGRRNVKVYVKGSPQGLQECSNAKVTPDLPIGISNTDQRIECISPPGSTSLLEMIVIFDEATTVQKSINFIYLENSVVDGIIPLKGIASGGNLLTVTGKKFTNAHKGYITGNGQTILCEIQTSIEMLCKVPALTEEQRFLLYRKALGTTSTHSPAGTTVTIIIHLDGVEKPFTIWYYSDPVFHPFKEDQQIKEFTSNEQILNIMGRNLNLVAEERDVVVTIGLANCIVIGLTENNISCVAPSDSPVPGILGASYPEVNVSIGNVRSTIGYLKYVDAKEEQDNTTATLVAAIISSFVVFAIIVVTLVVIYKKKVKALPKYQPEAVKIEQISSEELSMSQSYQTLGQPAPSQQHDYDDINHRVSVLSSGQPYQTLGQPAPSHQHDYDDINHQGSETSQQPRNNYETLQNTNSRSTEYDSLETTT